MRNTVAALAIAALSVACVAPARAASIDLGASELNGNTVDATDLGPGLLAIDPHFTNASPIEVAIVLEAEDAGSLAWNALVDNLTGEVWSAFTVEALGAAQLVAGSVAANAGAVDGVTASATAATIAFAPAEAAGLDLGAPFGVGDDWVVAANTGASTFRLRFTPVAVPEPSALLAIGMGLTALAAERRRSHSR